MNRIFLTFGFILAFNCIAGAIVDSTSVVMQTDLPAPEKIRWLNDYSARMLVEGNLIFAEKSALLAAKLSDETHFNFGKAKATIRLGQVAYTKNSYANAEVYFQEAVSLFNISGDKLNYARAKAMKADACFMENKLDSALSNYKAAYAQFSLGIIDDNLLATIHKRTGDVYCHLDALNEAENEYDNAIRVYSYVLKDIKRAGELAYNIGNVFLGLEHKDEAISYFNISERFFSELSDTTFAAESLLNLSHVLVAAGENNLAITNAEKSLKNYTVIKDSGKLIETMSWLGWLNAEVNKNKISEDYLNKAELLINQLSDKTPILKTYNIIGRTYEKLGNKEKSSKFYGLLATGSEDLLKQKQIKTFNESILNYNDATEGTNINPMRQKNVETLTTHVKTRTVFRLLGLLLISTTLLLAGKKFVQEKRDKNKIINNVGEVLTLANIVERDTIIEKEMTPIQENPKIEKSTPTIINPAIKIIETHSQTTESVAASVSPAIPMINHDEGIELIAPSFKNLSSPKEILDLIGGHIEQIKRLQKILFDKQLSDNYNQSFQALKTATYELQVLIDSIHTSMRVSNSTILNTETFFAPNDVINYVKEQLFLPSRIPITYTIDARLPSLLIGNGMRLSQIILQSIKGLSKPMIDGEVRVNMTRSEIIGEEITIKLDIEATGTGFIFDRLEKIINNDSTDAINRVSIERSMDESESALLFVKKLVRSKNDDIFLQRNAKKTILTAFLTFEVPIPNYLTMTEVHASLLPNKEKQVADL